MCQLVLPRATLPGFWSSVLSPAQGFHEQKGKESLEQATRDAGLKGDVYYTGPKPWQPEKAYKLIQPREVVVAKILQKEGRLTAIPAGWLTVPPVVLKWPKGLTPPAAVSADSLAAPQEESTAR